MNLSGQIAVLDRALALSRVGGDAELLQEMAALFLEECPGQMAAIRDAVGRRDPVAIERSAHSLKGSVGNFGAGIAHQAASSLEGMGREKNLQSVEGALTALESAIRDLQMEMETLSSGR